MWQIFIRKWVLANQRNEQCFTREKNNTPNQNHARDVFLRVQKNDTSNQRPQTFVPKFPPFIGF